MRKTSTERERSRGLNRRPLLRASSPLKINREPTLELVRQTVAHQCSNMTPRVLELLRITKLMQVLRPCAIRPGSF